MDDTHTVEDEQPQSISIRRRITVSRRMLVIAWQIRANAVCGFFVSALLEIGGTLATIYATARLGALLAAFVANRPAPHIWLWLWVDVGAGVVIGLAFAGMAYAKRLLYFGFVRWSTRTYLAALCRLDLGDYYTKVTRNQINKISGGYSWQMSNLSDANLDLMYGVLRFLAITAIVSQITWWLLPVVALFLLPSLLVGSRIAQLQWFVWDSKGDQRQIFWGLDWILRQAKGQMELRSLQASRFILNKIDTMNHEFYGEQERTYRRANVVAVPANILSAAGTAIGSVVLLRQLLGHVIKLDRYFFLSGALLRISGALNTIFGTLTRMQETLLFADSFFELVDRAPQMVDQPSAIKLSRATVPDIIFENVSFHYPGKDVMVFKDLNLHIQAGEHVALVGENGAGKSTLIKLLLRFYEPTAGRIMINGQDLRQVAISSWYDQLATLFQDFNQYPLPVRDNVQIGRSLEKPSQRRLLQAASFGGVDKMVAGYEHGWDTVLDSSFTKGTEPSGGQWQRVAIARAFYRQANVMVLDEPTSAIDALAEYNIFNSIFDHYKHKTAIIVSHRFSTVRRANRIIVLEHGKIIEVGDHQVLMKQGGAYHDLFTKQAEGYR